MCLHNNSDSITVGMKQSLFLAGYLILLAIITLIIMIGIIKRKKKGAA